MNWNSSSGFWETAPSKRGWMRRACLTSSGRPVTCAHDGWVGLHLNMAQWWVGLHFIFANASHTTSTPPTRAALELTPAAGLAPSEVWLSLPSLRLNRHLHRPSEGRIIAHKT